MNIEELEDKHYREFPNREFSRIHTKLSIEFAIEMLEECESFEDRYRRIQELKTYLK
jgi:hypothetical protein